MKKALFFTLAFLPMTLFSQQISPLPQTVDVRIYDAYGKAFVDKVAQDDPFLIKRWTYYLDHGYYVTDAIVSKDGVPVDYPSVIVTDLARLNILKLETEQNIKRDYFVETIYKIKGTNQFLVYHSGRNFIESLNDYLREKEEGTK